jgi:hypothetical protein
VEYKTLGCLRAPEAEIILNALETLGVGVKRDPAMPMLIEMENARRKSVFSWFWS